MLLWQSRPSCSNYMHHFGEAALWCSTACRDAKVISRQLVPWWCISEMVGPNIRERTVWGGEFIRLEWKSFTSRSILAFSFFKQWLGSSGGIDVPTPTQGHAPPWHGLEASQGSWGCALLPSGSSSSLSSLLHVNKCLPPLLVLIAFSLCSLGLGACGLQGLPGCQPMAWAIFWHTHDNSLLHSSIMPAHSKSPSSASPLTHDLLSYDLIHPNMFPQVVQPIKVAAPYSKCTQKLC